LTGYNIQIEKLCKKCALGELLCAPIPISGGLLHRMYDVKTSNGRFAIKTLNPEIMARKEAFNNYVISEKISSKLANVINVIGANLYHGNYIQEIDGQFYIIYDFKEGKSLQQYEITADHAYKIGVAVGKIHITDFSELNIHNDNTTETRCFNWDDLLEVGRKQNKEWCNLLEKNISRLYFLSDKMNEAYAALSVNEIICHGDLDLKNVLWLDNEPIIIDWESAWFHNPYHDFLETALYWSLNDDASIAYNRFSAFIKGYISIKRIDNSDWETVLYSGYSAKLGWLEYSLKRSLGIECNDTEERKLGTEQVTTTLNDIMQYENRISAIIDFLGAKLNG
jgi:Ser/Thr protein kinase RdoA (MazF antagonist)